MAKQTGPVIWETTIDLVSLYKRCGVGCARMKSNLTAERWRSDPLFAGSRKSAARMALAAKLASSFYQTIPQHQRRYSLYKQLVGVAQHMLCKGYNIQQVNKVLDFAVCRYLRKLQAAAADRKPGRSPFAATFSLKAKPAFTAAIPHLFLEPQFTTITISNSTFGLRPVIMPPRGSPAPINGCTLNRNPTSRSLPSIHQYSCKSQPFTMAGLIMSIPPQTGCFILKTAAKLLENISGNNFQPSNCFIVP
ncbi:hypothetical protein [Filimonas effusa]|uniref:Uncharacterized protein n=1 Tax=Filimonas effusa TaxID=2508721 RepID=A0A4Q1D725_9BACT|nr:hypothetical protein [Filimonas effusa]RXK83477.1 hypothetical protein ESB13_15395 [Filimonas effusa]